MNVKVIYEGLDPKKWAEEDRWANERYSTIWSTDSWSTLLGAVPLGPVACPMERLKAPMLAREFPLSE